MLKATKQDNVCEFEKVTLKVRRDVVLKSKSRNGVLEHGLDAVFQDHRCILSVGPLLLELKHIQTF